MEDLKFYEDKMNKTLDVLVSDYAAIRAGRANPMFLIRSELTITALRPRFSRWAMYLFPRPA